MKKKINVVSSEITKTEFVLFTEGAIAGLTARGQMLVDSVGFSFVYLADDGEDYTYIVFTENQWPDLKIAAERNLPSVLKSGEDVLELKGLHEELGYLVENIKGNSNYGEEMVAKVEAIFQNE